MTSPSNMSNRALEQYTIAQQLGESTPAAIGLIGRIIRELGSEQARQFLEQALTTQANGGMLTEDGSRQRTLGGIFFFLVKQHLREHGQEALADQLFPRRQRRQASKPAPTQSSAALGPLPPPLPPPGPQGRLRPRVRSRAEQISAPIEAAAPPEATPAPQGAAATGQLDPHRALDIARQTLTAAHGAYAIGAQVADHTLLIRFYFPDTAQQRYREQIEQIEQSTGWAVRVHPAPHQEQLAKAAQQALALGDTLIGVPSIRFASKQVVLRSTQPIAETILATAQVRFREETGWTLMVQSGNQEYQADRSAG
ncbi:MAG: hypothetical protein Fur005_46080 [Roseiflexaceae bacterium]